MTIQQHLLNRHCNPEWYRIFIDEVEGVASFLLYDLSGAIVGYQQYRPRASKNKSNHPRQSRYFTYRNKDRLGVFGLETWDWSEPLFICEGIFDAVRLHQFGFAAIATLSNDPKFLDEWFFLTQRSIYSICDEGKAGDMLKEYTHRHRICRQGDLGDMSESDIVAVLRDAFGLDAYSQQLSHPRPIPRPRFAIPAAEDVLFW